MRRVRYKEMIKHIPINEFFEQEEEGELNEGREEE